MGEKQRAVDRQQKEVLTAKKAAPASRQAISCLVLKSFYHLLEIFFLSLFEVQFLLYEVLFIYRSILRPKVEFLVRIVKYYEQCLD